MTLEQLAEQTTEQLTGHANPKETAPLDYLKVINAMLWAYEQGQHCKSPLAYTPAQPCLVCAHRFTHPKWVAAEKAKQQGDG